MRKVFSLLLVFTSLSALAYEISEEELSRLDELIGSLETLSNEQETEIKNLNSELSEQEKEISNLKSLYQRQEQYSKKLESELTTTQWVARAELAIIIILTSIILIR